MAQVSEVDELLFSAGMVTGLTDKRSHAVSSNAAYMIKLSSVFCMWCIKSGIPRRSLQQGLLQQDLTEASQCLPVQMVCILSYERATGCVARQWFAVKRASFAHTCLSPLTTSSVHSGMKPLIGMQCCGDYAHSNHHHQDSGMQMSFCTAGCSITRGH